MLISVLFTTRQKLANGLQDSYFYFKSLFSYEEYVSSPFEMFLSFSILSGIFQFLTIWTPILPFYGYTLGVFFNQSLLNKWHILCVCFGGFFFVLEKEIIYVRMSKAKESINNKFHVTPHWYFNAFVILDQISVLC